jgi:hypothetical protein
MSILRLPSCNARFWPREQDVRFGKRLICVRKLFPWMKFYLVKPWTLNINPDL